MAKRILGLLNLYSSPNLGPLTEHRTLGSTSFLGRFAIMDFALSNFTNSGIDEFSILVKDNFRSVSKHVGSLKTWVNNTKIARQNILLNEKGIAKKEYNTDLNNILENEWLLYESNPDLIVVQPAHIISTMDLRPVIDFHLSSGADVTVVYKKISDADKAFNYSNTLEVDKSGRVTKVSKNTGENKKVNVSLETYVISRALLTKLIHARGESRELSLKRTVVKLSRSKTTKVFGYEYKGYARCIDSFKHFCEYSFELLNYKNATVLFDNDWTAYTVSHNTPPTTYGIHSSVKNCYIANGAFVDGHVENSIISRSAKIGKGAVVKNSIVLANTVIGENAHVENAVLDKLVKVRDGAELIGHKEDLLYISQGKIIK